MDIPRSDKFIERMAVFLGNPVTEEMLVCLKQKIVSFYQEQGYPIVAVFIPAGQTFSCSTIQVLILVSKLGAVKSEGARYFSNQKITSMFPTQPGQTIRSEVGKEDLQLINLNPFRSTTLIYEPGAKTGETHVILVTQDRFPLRVYGGYENTGNP